MTKAPRTEEEKKLDEEFRKYEATLPPIDPNAPPDPEAESIAMNIRRMRKKQSDNSSR